MDKIAKELQQLVDTNEMAGGVLIVRKRGNEIYRNKWGYMDIASQKPTEYNTMYSLCSMTKPITSVAILMLEEQGKLSLEDTIDTYIPGFVNDKVCEIEVESDGSYKPSQKYPADMTLDQLMDVMHYVPAKRKLTIRDLLTHSSGLGMGGISQHYMEIVNKYGDTLSTRIEKWKNCPLDFQPGEATGYSPFANMEILGRIVEIVSNREFSDFLNKKIFDPLEIHDITFHMNNAQQMRFSSLYKREHEKLVYVPEEQNEFLRESKAGYYSGAAGLIGSVEDYDKFTTMLSNGGSFHGARILKEETVRRIYEETGEHLLEFQPGIHWGLGMVVFSHPELLGAHAGAGTYGWSGAYGTHMFIHPASGISATFGMNRLDIGGAASPIARKVEELVFDTFGEN